MTFATPRLVQRALACLSAALTALTPAATNAQARFHRIAAPADAGELWVRDALAGPSRYRVVVVPGSGCESLVSSMDRMFRNLVHAQVWLLQKPNLSPAGTSGPDCNADFVRADDLAAWRLGAVTLLGSATAQSGLDLPWVLVGMSEGAELLPHLAPALPRLVLLVMLGNAGLDPVRTGALQAQRLGLDNAWQQLMGQTRHWQLSDDRVLHGRSARYWHVLQTWPLLAPLLSDGRPLLQVRGGHDALIPATAYAEFADHARLRRGGHCAVVFAQADHELREGIDNPDNPATPAIDRLQSVWRWIDTAAQLEPPQTINCAALQAEALAAD